MSELFPMFGDEHVPVEARQSPLMMTQEQRVELRLLFAQVGATTARDQFRLVEELTGTRIHAVSELQAAHAHRAITGLRRRAATATEHKTGNAWDGRDSPTWIDRL